MKDIIGRPVSCQDLGMQEIYSDFFGGYLDLLPVEYVQAVMILKVSSEENESKRKDLL